MKSGSDDEKAPSGADTPCCQFSHAVDPGASRYDIATAIVVSLDGSMVFVTGRSTGRSTGSRTQYDYATGAYDASTGARLWVKRFSGPGKHDDYARSIGAAPDGNRLFVTGSSVGSADNNDYATLAYGTG